MDKNPRAEIIDLLFDTGCIRMGEFTLKSGLISPIYIDLRAIISDPRLLRMVGEAYLPMLKDLRFDRVAGLPYAAIPISTAICLAGGFPMIYPRKEAKEYGTKAQIEGNFKPGETAVVIDDLATTGGSKFEAIDKLRQAGLHVSDVVVLVDRESGARESLTASGVKLHTVFTLSQMLEHWQANGKVSPDRINAVREFIRKSK